MGSDLSTADEWLELFADADTDVSGWTLTSVNSSGIEVPLITFAPGTMLGSGSYTMISNYDAEHSRLASDSRFVTTGLSLPNTKLLLRLKNSSGQILDVADDYIGVPFAGENGSGTGARKSMERISYASGGLKTSWATAMTARGFDVGFALFGTPGFPNGTSDPVVSSSSESSASSSIESSSGSSVSSVSSGSSSFHSSLSSTSSISVQPYMKLKISEVLSNSIGEDSGEWIEIWNTGDAAVSLSGITISDKSNKYIVQGSGLILNTNSYWSFRKTVTGLSLDNKGETVTIKSGSIIIDSLTYIETAEEVSYGRDAVEPGVLRAYCVPTEGRPNEVRPMPVQILIQSGSPEGVGKVSINLEAVTASGSLASAQCHFDFGDGYASESCNPPSHSFTSVGDFVVTLSATDYCSNTVVQTLAVRVLPKGTAKKKEPNPLPNPDPIPDSCSTDTGAPIRISEFIPDPLTDEAEDEWIELENLGAEPVKLCGWTLDDAAEGSTPFELKDFLVPGRGYTVIPRPRSGIALNNDGDDVRLFAPGGRLADEEAFTRAIPGESYALRNDGNFVWTPYHTPGSPNRFRTAERRFPTDRVIVSAALPNPIGLDRDLEWIELTNVSDDAIALSDWLLDNGEGGSKPFRLRGIQLASMETRRFSIQETGVELRNSSDTARYLDPDGNVVSVLAWTEAEEGRIYRPYAFAAERVKAHVIHTVDGDTFDMVLTDIDHLDRVPEEIKRRWLALEDTDHPSIRVRMIGIDTPETVHPNKSVERYGIEASNYVRSLLLNKNIELEFDTEMWDKYQRLLAYVYVDGALVEAKILQNGFGYAYLRYPFVRSAEFNAYEAEAKKAKLGLWSDPEVVQIIDSILEDTEQQVLFESEGLHIAFDPKPGLVSSGAQVRFETSRPSQVYLSENSGAFIPFTGSYIVTKNVSLTAFAEAEIESGAIIRSEHISGRYSVPIVYRTGSLVISEVYPAPAKGETEWVEIENLSNESIDLSDWFLDDISDAGSTPWKIPPGNIISPNEILVLPSAPILGRGSGWKLAFNNDGDDVNLLTPDKMLAAKITYPKTKHGFSFARDPKGDSFCLTEHPTPGAPNECVVTMAAAKKSAKTKAAAKKTSAKKKTKSKPKKLPVRYRNVISGENETAAADEISEKLMRLRELEGGSSPSFEPPSSMGHILKYEFLAYVVALLLLLNLTFRRGVYGLFAVNLN